MKKLFKIILLLCLCSCSVGSEDGASPEAGVTAAGRGIAHISGVGNSREFVYCYKGNAIFNSVHINGNTFSADLYHGTEFMGVIAYGGNDYQGKTTAWIPENGEYLIDIESSGVWDIIIEGCDLHET